MNRSAVFYTTPFFPAGILDIRLCGLFGAMPHWLLVKKGPAQGRSLFMFRNYLRGFLIFACAAASLAIGTRKGEQET